MSIRNTITEKIVLPLSDFVLDQSVSKHFRFLQKSQWWSKVEINEYQNKKLRELIKHAYENVPYYTELFDSLSLTPNDIKTTKDITKLPILTKEIVRENMKNGKLIAKNISKRKMILNGSSGSTGEPLQYYISKEAYSFNIAANLRGWYWMGYRLGDKYTKLSQNPRNGIVKKSQDWINNCYYTVSQSLSKQDISNIVAELVKNNVTVIRGYPSTIYILANYIFDEGINGFSNLKAIATTGEILFPYMRKKIESVFNCKIFDAYSGEGGAVVFECETHEKYHLTAEYAYTEFVRNHSYNMEVGSGEIISTDFWNFAVPFIRYNSKDVAIMSDENCSCERGLPVLSKIEGRDVDILTTPSGKSLIVHYFTGYFEWITSVVQFQIIQYEQNKIVLKLVPNDLFNEKEKDKIFNDMSVYIGDDVFFSIEIVDNIPVNPKNGKRKFVLKK
ncbi:phenylacetate--CoA ligase family protein [Lentimicrobium sp. S6]|uniref:phenylacetate--CoA ligase family protein n=1 Tax=Lentimicrobium sp. S6 TaxID=2735872 RepID=UPI001553201C|nr:phenylacetate--CoA ligase family protein [Lentimicrobium sp. S6]NPD46728.1 phenylacetate--CoA ligase family protein [Lentimicrobium sp. S6]